MPIRKIKNVDANYPWRENPLKRALKTRKENFAQILSSIFLIFQLFACVAERNVKINLDGLIKEDLFYLKFDVSAI